MSHDPEQLDKESDHALDVNDILTSQAVAAPVFAAGQRRRILAVALVFAFMTAMQISAYSISLGTLAKNFMATPLQATLGISTYGWGFAIGPLIFAPITERYGRYRFMIVSTVIYTLLHLSMTLARDITTVIVGRFFLGLAGCGGATVVAGIVSDLYPGQSCSMPMSLFTLSIVAAPGIGGATMCWVEMSPYLGWRWVQWIMMILAGLYIPVAILLLAETRTIEEQVIARQVSLYKSCSQPIVFLFTEPVVLCFALWAGLSWGVFYFVIAGMPYVFQHEFGFSTEQAGSAFISLTIGAVMGWVSNFGQEVAVKRYWHRFNVESRLLAAMCAAILFSGGCFLFGFTAVTSCHWMGPAIGAIIVTMCVYTIDQTCFLYLSECYGASASSAVAAMAFIRVALGSCFAIVTQKVFETLSARWALVMMGALQLVFSVIPFGMFFFGPRLRRKSRFCALE